AVAAADVEHARAVFDHLGDQQVIDAVAIAVCGRYRRQRQCRLSGHGVGCPAPRQRATAAESMKARAISRNSGTSSRKASWPLSVSISANDTRAPPALSARTTACDSGVGNSQSLVNEMTQKRVGVPRNAFASVPSWS